MIELKKLQFSYGNKILFKGLSCVFEKNHIYGIIGENGAGKSSLLDAIIGLYKECCQGEILYNNKSIDKFDMKQMLKTEISFLEQNSERLNISAKEFLRFGIDNVHEHREHSLIVDLFEETSVSIEDLNDINLCSSGEFQKLSLIRILQKDSSLLILDEPTTGLDFTSVKNLVRILLRDKLNKITIIVTHDSRILKICDKVIEIGRN
ncbi:ATP-binding cassette domain-containing protein [Eubacterium sp. MSJ-13]|uniref:ATP-binding cassette domain-containing protein n=1 Tax=Eubacterium sp. MSJ-13 TaxID=2841513 RepID=UPI00209D617B|nr:ATP-binding cassette domain-containing protein [Eubacterium sp. MSJ-13]